MKGKNNINFSGFNPEKHINLIKFICSRYVHAGFIKIDEEEDFLHNVIERLIKRTPVLRRNFNGGVKVATYLAVVVNNLCKEEIRKCKHHDTELLTFSGYYQDSYTNIDQNIYFEDEIEKIKKIFILFNRKRLKLEICFKGYYSIKFTPREIEYLPQVINKMIKKLNESGIDPKSKKQDKYTQLASIINYIDNKETNPEAVRKWIKSKIDEVITILNGNPKHANYDEESLGILLVKYYENHIIFL